MHNLEFLERFSSVNFTLCSPRSELMPTIWDFIHHYTYFKPKFPSYSRVASWKRQTFLYIVWYGAFPNGAFHQWCFSTMVPLINGAFHQWCLSWWCLSWWCLLSMVPLSSMVLESAKMQYISNRQKDQPKVSCIFQVRKCLSSFHKFGNGYCTLWTSGQVDFTKFLQNRCESVF